MSDVAPKLACTELQRTQPELECGDTRVQDSTSRLRLYALGIPITTRRGDEQSTNTNYYENVTGVTEPGGESLRSVVTVNNKNNRTGL